MLPATVILSYAWYTHAEAFAFVHESMQTYPTTMHHKPSDTNQGNGRNKKVRKGSAILKLRLRMKVPILLRQQISVLKIEIDVTNPSQKEHGKVATTSRQLLHANGGEATKFN